MKQSKNGNFILSDSEMYALVHAFDNFRAILKKGQNGNTYIVNSNMSCLSEYHYDICVRLYKSYFK